MLLGRSLVHIKLLASSSMMFHFLSFCEAPKVFLKLQERTFAMDEPFIAGEQTKNPQISLSDEKDRKMSEQGWCSYIRFSLLPDVGWKQ